MLAEANASCKAEYSISLIKTPQLKSSYIIAQTTVICNSLSLRGTVYGFEIRGSSAFLCRLKFCLNLRRIIKYKSSPRSDQCGARGAFAAIRAHLKSGHCLKNRRGHTSLVLFASAIVERTGDTNGRKSCKIITERQAEFTPNGQGASVGFFMRVHRPSRG